MGSQFGENMVIDEVFPAEMTSGYAVDVGASDGVFLSNTLDLEKRGWDVLCVEPNKMWNCGNNRKLVLEVACGAENAEDQDFTIVTMGPHQGYWAACSALKPDAQTMQEHAFLTQGTSHISVPVRTLDWCLAEAKFPRLDFASIDVEGGEMDVLRGWDIGRWVPKLIIIENWSGDSRFINYFKPYGYKRTIRLGVNDCFIRS